MVRIMVLGAVFSCFALMLKNLDRLTDPYGDGVVLKTPIRWIINLDFGQFSPVLESEKRRRLIFTARGWATKHGNYRINAAALRALNPDFHVRVRYSFRRELWQSRSQVGLRPGFVVTAFPKKNSEVSIQTFRFFATSQELHIANLTTTNHDATFAMSNINHFQRSTESAELCYIDAVDFHTVYVNRAAGLKFISLLQRFAKQSVIVANSRFGFPLSKYLIMAFGSPYDYWARNYDRASLMVGFGASSPQSNLLLKQTVKHFEWGDAQNSLPRLETRECSPSVCVFRESRGKIPVPGEGWVQISNAHIYPGNVVVENRFIHLVEQAAYPENGFISGFSGRVETSRHNPHEVLLEPVLQSELVLKDGILIGGRNDSNWYHFLVEYLPRINQIPSEIPDCVPVVISDSVPPTGVEALQLLTSREIKIISSNNYTAVSKLWVSAPTGQVLDNSSVKWVEGIALNSNAIREMAAALVAKIAPDSIPTRKVFLRRSSGHRNARNQDQLEAIAKSRGLEVVDLSTLSFPEQVELFASSMLIVGASGAVMANYIFMKNGSRVVALTSSKLRNFVLPALLARVANAHFTYLLGEANFRLLRLRKSQMHDDFWISPSKFRNLIISELRNCSNFVERHTYS